MDIQVADQAGMCFGVRRALDLALQTRAEGKDGQGIAVLGQLVHNPSVSDWLGAHGIEEKAAAEKYQPGDIAIIPSHGKGPAVYQILRERGCAIVDATCPFVSQAREKALQSLAEGYMVLILGDPSHAEVAAYYQWLDESCRVLPLSEEEWNLHDLPDKVAILVQTTEDPRRLARLLEHLSEVGILPVVLNTVCPATSHRREAAASLAAVADTMLVVGGKNSANTRNLTKLCEEIQPKTYLIETKRDIDFQWLKGIKLLGITAGASTPEWIIKEVVEMTEEFKDQDLVPEQDAQHLETKQEQEAEANFSEMEAEMGCREFHPGDVVKGIVVKVSSDEILVDIGYKSEGIIPAFELAFTKVDPQTVAQVGDEIITVVMKEDREGNILLSRKNALFEEKIKSLEEAFEKGEPVTATVIDVVKGGLLVDVGMRGFVPASHVERGFVKDLSEYLNKTMTFKILELNRGGRKVILSRKAMLEEEYQKIKEEFWSNIEEGMTKTGVVKRLTDFGAFVDIGGCDGLLHVSEMGWGKVAKPADAVAINDEIEVYVLKVDRDKEKVSLSLKKLLSNPWDVAAEKYQPGEIYSGKVMRSASFGAFIQLEPGLEGLAHISQLARFRVNKVEDVLEEGMEIPVKVLDIDLEKKRISLSVKEAIDLPKLAKDEMIQEEAEATLGVAASEAKETVGEEIGADTEATATEDAADAIIETGVAEESVAEGSEIADEAEAELAVVEEAAEVAAMEDEDMAEVSADGAGDAEESQE